MSLGLRIENFDQLENGGPTWFQLDGRGASIGRRAAMDWSLPDPTKMISGHHFDIAYRDGKYFLTDVSMNGTFLDGQRHRLEGPLELKNGQRLIVGHYIVLVELPTPAAAADPMDVDDPWASDGIQPVSGGHGPGIDALNDGFIPVQRPSLQASPQGGMKTETSLQIPIHTQGPGAVGGLQAPGGWGTPPQQPVPGPTVTPSMTPGVPYTPTLGQETPDPADAFGPEHASPQAPATASEAPEVYRPSFALPEIDEMTPPQGRAEPRQPSAPSSAPPSAPPSEPAQGGYPQPPQGYPQPPQPFPQPPQGAPSSIPMPRPVPPNPAPSATPTPQPQPPRPPRPDSPPPTSAGTGGDVSALLRAFCEGAGLDPNSVRPEDALGLMHMLGRVARISTEEIMLMLKARADVKNFTRGGVRTMLSANANNPMKFMPDSQQALELMFTAPRDGFMTGADSFDDALKDIRLHQEAVFRALQPALAEVFRGLSPEEIEASCGSTGSNLLAKRSGKQWQTYEERWDEKAQAGENGILDAFLQAFARAYAEANNRKS
jgi:type VI secretion system FHA domain protein